MLCARNEQRRQQTNDEEREKSDEDFKNKYPFNLFSFISCRLKTLMKQFFKLKWFILRKIILSLFTFFSMPAYSRREVRFTSLALFRAEANDKLEEINFSFSTVQNFSRERRVSDGRKFWHGKRRRI